MATEKTSNDYREERKARLAKSAKKNAKKSHKVSAPSLSGKAKASIAIVICVALAVVIAVTSCVNLGVFERAKTIKTVSGESYSAVEYEYYYNFLHNYYYSTAQQYDSYYGTGYGYYYTGYDYSKLPEDQQYPGTDYVLDDGSKPTWKEYFEHTALTNLQQYKIMVDLAEADANFTVDEDVIAEAMGQIDEMKETLKTQAESNGSVPVTFSKYLREAYGKGMTEKIFTKIVREQTISSEYSKYLMEQKADEYTLAELEEVYKKDTSAYNCVDFRVFTIAPETVKHENDATQAEKDAANKQASEAAKKKADEMFGKITDEASFIKLAEQYATKEQKESADYTKPEATLMAYTEKATISGSFSEDAVKWLYSADTKAGDKKVFEISGTYYVIYMVKPSYRDDATFPVDVRHILVQFDEEATDAEADKKSKKADAETIATTIKNADDPLAKFLELCETKSDDTASASNGGLIQYLTRGKYVKAFEEWSLDKSRKAGDIEVIETEYGYHVMYFDKSYDKPYWQISIAQTLANEALNDQLDEAMASDAYKVAADDKLIPTLNEKIYNKILNNYYPDVTKAEPSTAA